MAAALKVENMDGDVVHLRIPPDLKQLMQKVAKLRGRSLTQHMLLSLEETHLGLREVRLLKGEMREN